MDEFKRTIQESARVYWTCVQSAPGPEDRKQFRRTARKRMKAALRKALGMEEEP